jgi:hypothetical protein
MFEAAIKERIKLFVRKNDQETVFDIWVEMAKTESFETHFGKRAWKPEMTIAHVLDCVDDYCHSVDEKIRGKHSEGKDKK